MKCLVYLLCLVAFFTATNVFAQQVRTDSIVVKTDSSTQRKNPAFTKDTLVYNGKGGTMLFVPKHSPKTATLRSLVLPGWGQVYNKEYWKLPIIYGALGITAGIYIYNNTWYKRTRDAYDIRVSGDTSRVKDIHPKLEPLSAQSLLIYRNSFRQDRDYSALWFIIFWGLNVADATVFAHLKGFDVSPDLSLNVKPTISSNGFTGVGLVLGYKSPTKPRIFNVR